MTRKGHAMFSLLIVELPLRGSAKEGIKGPWLFPSEYAAESALFKRVCEEISVCYRNDFLEAAPNLELPDWVYSVGTDDEGWELEPPAGDLECRLEALNREEKRAVVDWYFSLMNDSMTQAFYRIRAHVQPYTEGDS